MSTFWRIALAWMLALALPLQGHATQRLLAGGALPSPATALARAAAPPAHDALAAGLHDSMKSGHAGHCDKASASGAAESAKPGSTGSCSACASCCHAAALPPSVPLLPLLAAALPAVPEVHLPLALVWPDSLERPPRLSQR